MRCNRTRPVFLASTIAAFVFAATTVSVAQIESPESQESESRPASSGRPGIVTTPPQGVRSVKVDDGYMVPYETTIPGTKVKFQMVPIPGGKFTIGSPDDETGRRSDEGPRFDVVVEPFWMGKYEVTWAEYKQYMKLDSVFKAFQARKLQTAKFTDVDAITAPSSLYDPSFTYEAGDEPKQPAASMSQYAAKQYTKWLSLLSGDFYRLPTEAEWEYACRANTTTAFHFGDDPDDLKKYAWYEENSEELRQTVGKLKPNAWGLHDMYGNVAEWVLDGYVEQYDPKLAGKTVSVQQAYVSPTKVYPRVLRGGSWELEVEDCRSAARMASNEEWLDEDPNYPQSPWWFTTSPGLGSGFRLIRPLNPPESRDRKERFWQPQVERITRDARNRIFDNGRGSFGIVTPELPEKIEQLRKK